MSLVNKVLTKLWFSKTWLSKENFPTYEMREDQVRADMQYLHDETQTAFNNLVDDLESLSAENIPFTSSTAVPASDVQSAIVNVQQQVAEASAATIPNGSITDEKLATGVPTNKADLVGGIVKANQLRFRFHNPNDDDMTGTVGAINYTLQATDASSIVVLPEPWGSRITIPYQSDIPVGSVILIYAMGGYTPIVSPLVFALEDSFYTNLHVFDDTIDAFSRSTTQLPALFILIRLQDGRHMDGHVITNWFLGRLG